MSSPDPVSAQTSASSGKMLRAMVGIGVLCALLIVLTFEGTLPRIERLRAEALENAIFKVIPGTTQTKAYKYMQNSGFAELSEGEKADRVVYAGFGAQGNLTGIAVEASGQGYADILRILYGYDPNTQTIVGFYVLESKETPGLGDKIEKDPKFLANFEALDVSLTEDLSAIKNTVVTVKSGAKTNPWEVDGITGATISSRAIGNIIGASTKEWVPILNKNKEVFKAD
jgi:electron transport complex protein RnfG